MRIINLTQHISTADQVAAGVIDLPEAERASLQKLLTFKTCPSMNEVLQRSLAIREFARGYDFAMIGGAPYLMGYLEGSLHEIGCQPLYSFTERVSIEEIQTDGSVKKSLVFKHIGWVGLE